MANTSQARKRARQQIVRRQRNVAQQTSYRTHVKNVRKAVATGDKEAAVAAYKAAVRVIDTLAGKGKVHRNKAARHKSRLNAQVKALATG